MRQLRLLIGTLVTVGLLAVLVVSPAYADPPFAPPGLARAMATQEAHTDALLRIQGVVGTAVGLAEGGPVIKILTEHPGVAGLPRTLDGVPVEVQVTGKIFALHHRPGHSGGPGGGGSGIEGGSDCSTTEVCPRPVPIGVSTGHPDITAGTIGARLIDVKDPENPDDDVFYVLSNNHVYANENTTSMGDAVIQPGTFDGGSSPADDIGTLANFITIHFDPDLTDNIPGLNNVVDAAIALSSTENLGNATPSDGYGTPKSTIIVPSVGLRVQKYGRTTGLTQGRVSAINATLDVGYDSGVARFVNQIIIEPGSFSAGGDSGSLVVGVRRQNKRVPVGLLFAGSFFVTIANPIDEVLSAFGGTVSIDGE